MQVIQFIASRGYGGAEKVFVDLCNNLSKISNIGLEVILLENNMIEDKLDKNIKIYLIKDRSRLNPFLYTQIIKTVKNKIVHTHSVKASEIIYKLSKFIEFIHLATKHNTRKGKVFSKIKHVTAVSKSVANSIKNHKKIKIIYNGITPKIPIKRDNHNSIFNILVIGRLDKIKGFNLLIDEISKVKKEYILNIAGDGKEFSSLNSQIIKLGLEERVKLLGFKKDIPQLLSDADLVLITSLDEGFSMVALEAICYSKVLLSTKVGICKEILPKKLIFNISRISQTVENVIDSYSSYEDAFLYVKEKYNEKFLLQNITNEYISLYRLIG